MMLLKPDRKYTRSFVYKYYDNFINDYIKKMFAVSLLHDEDFPDYNGPKKPMDKGNQGQNPTSPNKFNPRDEPITTIREEREEDNSDEDRSPSNQNSNSEQIDTNVPGLDFTQAAQDTAFARDANDGP
jgi:hypothetical protein